MADKDSVSVVLTEGKKFGVENQFLLRPVTLRRMEKKEVPSCWLRGGGGWHGKGKIYFNHLPKSPHSHFHYVPEILAAFFWCIPASISSEFWILPLFYPIYLTILLTDRAWRDDKRCADKYQEYWTQYCRKVPNKILPGII